MIRELARIEILEGHGPAFEADVTEMIPLFRRAEGCLAMHLSASVDRPNLY